jgi:rod shape determining protein RodA
MFKDLFKNVSIALILVPLVLTVVGVLFIFSTGGGPNHFLYIKQIAWVLFGLVIAVFLLNIDYFRLIEISPYLYAVGLVLLVVTLLLGQSVRGAKSWIRIGEFGIQVSELMKVFFILFLAKYLSSAPVTEKKFRVFLVSLGIMLLPVILIIVQPNLGTALVYVCIFLTMAYLGFEDDRYVLYILVVGISTAAVIILTAFYKYYLQNGGVSIGWIDFLLNFKTLGILSGTLLLYAALVLLVNFFRPIALMQRLVPAALISGISLLTAAAAIRVLKPFQWLRFLVLISPEFDKNGAGYNIIQSKIAIGSGGLFGKGLFQGTQNTLGFLPEKNTDFIFSVIGEETGFFGTSLVIGLFVFYLFNLVRTLQNARDREGMLAAAGLLALFGTHFLVNIGMTLGIIPVAGLPLPFISYGGSAYITFIGAAAIVANINGRRFVH